MTSCATCLDFPKVTRSTCEAREAHRIEPLKDPRWDSLLGRHPRASVFHSFPWLQALKWTYGYEPIAYTTSPAGQDLENAIVFCRVNSWLTGRRLVSLPFSDHCAPLVDGTEDIDVLAAALEEEVERERLDYMEVRPLQSFDLTTLLCRTTITYSYHKLDLRPDLDVLFENLHKSSTQRKIRRAEREALTYREGSTPEFLDHFYHLFTLTRQRHRLPPQPKAWFANLMECFGETLKIRLAFKNNRPLAGIITIAYKDTLSYKYGGCDSKFNNLGCMHLLLWRSIEDAKASRLHYLDFGRTDAGQQSLIIFKNRWGASQSVVTYSRYGVSKRSTHFFDLSMTKWKAKTAKYVMAHLPSPIVSKIGQALYGHVG
jgi:hypothetical protein